MAQTIVTLSGDDAELYKAFQRILDQQAKTDAGYKKIRGASKEAADAAKAAAKEQADAEKQQEFFKVPIQLNKFMKINYYSSISTTDIINKIMASKI